MRSPKYTRFRPSSESEGWGLFGFVKLILLLFSAVWLLAIVKVFLLEKSRIEFEDLAASLPTFDDPVEIPVSSEIVGFEPSTIIYKSRFDEQHSKVENVQIGISYTIFLESFSQIWYV
jgi:hypothetical protein